MSDSNNYNDTQDIDYTADLITRLSAKAIVEAYRAGKKAGEAESDRLREALEFYADGEWNERYPCGVWYDHDEAIIDFGQIARAALQEKDDEV